MNEKELIVQILDQIANANINRCVLTTYDLSVAEGVRQDIINVIKKHYGVEYQIQPSNVKLFPVKGGMS